MGTRVLSALAALSLVLVSCDAIRAQKRTPAEPAVDLKSVVPFDAKGDPPAEKRFHNIQVLKGLPSSQLYDVMAMMSNSLGVTCAHCHTEYFEEEDRVEKQTAREMILLTRAINRAQFQGQPTVTCFTCHRGAQYPATMPDLAFAGWQKMIAPKPAAPALPSTDTVLAKYDATITRGATPHGRGEVTVVGGLDERKDGAFELTAEGLKASVRIPPPVQEALARTGFGAIDIRARYDGLNVLRRVENAIVVGAQKGDSPPERLTFDAESGRLLRIQQNVRTDLGYLPEEVRFSDYRDGLPYTVEWARGDYLVTLRFSELAR